MKSVANISRIVEDEDDFVIVTAMDVDDDDDDKSYDHCDDEWITYTRSKDLLSSSSDQIPLEESKKCVIDEDTASMISQSDEDRGVDTTATCQDVSEKKNDLKATYLSLDLCLYKHKFIYPKTE